MKYLLDTSQIVDWIQKGTIENNFYEMNESGDEIWVSLDVMSELRGILEDNELIKFENLLKEGIKAGYVVGSHHKYRLREPFKTLAQDLRREKVRLERTDRNLIALSYQIKGKIKTTDPGIMIALDILKHANGPWKKYAVAMDRENIEDFSEHINRDNTEI